MPLGPNYMTGSPCFLFEDARNSFPSGVILELILGKGKIMVEGSSTDYFCIMASNDELNEDIPFFFGRIMKIFLSPLYCTPIYT